MENTLQALVNKLVQAGYSKAEILAKLVAFEPDEVGEAFDKAKAKRGR